MPCRCTAHVTNKAYSFGLRTKPCSRMAVEGTLFCAQHDPAAVKAREEAAAAERRRRWLAKQARRQADWNRRLNARKSV